MSVLVAIHLAQPALYAKDIKPRLGRGKEIRDVRGLSSMDVSRYREIITNFLGQLDSAKITIYGIEVGNEINWANFNGDLPLLSQKVVYLIPWIILNLIRSNC